VPVVGRVTMDMTMVDVTDIECQLGDVATLLGRDGQEHLDINVIAEQVDLLSYELLVGLKLRAPRIHHGGGA
jgi:alanine racemase